MKFLEAAITGERWAIHRLGWLDGKKKAGPLVDPASVPSSVAFSDWDDLSVKHLEGRPVKPTTITSPFPIRYRNTTGRG